MALTVGLLLFLGIDSIEEALEVSAENLADSFNGVLLVATVTILSFLGLYYSGEKLIRRVKDSPYAKPVAIALMISIGIGLHNFGEGLAIGAAIGLGQVALSTFLIVGFALHNTTEGLAIAAPLAKEKKVCDWKTCSNGNDSRSSCNFWCMAWRIHVFTVFCSHLFVNWGRCHLSGYCNYNEMASR